MGIMIAVITLASLLLSIFSKDGISTTGTILITEVMASNKSAVVDDTGQYNDWIEIYNPGRDPVSLAGWGLSDSVTVPVKWAFPDLTLEPGEYLVLFCSKLDKRDPSAVMHTNFGLSASGESVVLTDNVGNIVDYITFENMASDTAMGRDPINDNQWRSYEKVSPGYPNTDAGTSAYLATLKATDTSLRITEAMSDNLSTLVDDYGMPTDWVEIYNSGTEAINLKGYGLSDKANKLMKWTFPDITIQPGQYLLVYCSGKGAPKTEGDLTHLHTNFGISNYAETLVLCNNKGQILDTVDLPQLESDTAYALDLNNNTWERTVKPTPGAANSDAGFASLANLFTSNSQIVISEAMSYNSKYAAAGSYYYDWVELHNTSGSAINLKGWALTDDTAKPLKWTFPDVTIQPNEYLLVYCSGLNKKSGTLHTNFRISTGGEVLALCTPDGTITDHMGIQDVPSDMSMGRQTGQSGFFYFKSPSPRAANSGGARGFAAKPTIELPGGSYRGEQTVSISTTESGATIYYTTDGTVPTQNSRRYTGPITVSETTALRASAFTGDMLGSAAATATYFIDVPHTLPIVSLVTDPDNLFSSSTGIYALGPATSVEDSNANFKQDWERDVHFEYVLEDGSLAVALDGGIKIFGAYSRMKDQKGFSIWARSRYGTDRIEYPLFKTRPYTSYQCVVLRAGAQDSTQSKIRDIVITDLVRDYTTLEVAAYEQCVVYINGQYWGAYNLREKINKYMLAQHNNLANPENIDLIVGNSRALVGDNKDYKALVSYVSNNDTTDPAVYNRIKEWMDVENFADWIVCQAWTNNADLGNIKFWRERTPEGKWRWIFYDFCWGMYNPEMDGIARMLNPEGMGAGNSISTALLRGLIKNQEFKQLFLERCVLHFNTTFARDRVLAKIEECASALEGEIGRDRERWKNGTEESWRRLQISKMQSFTRVRSDYMIYFVRKNLGLSVAETKALFGSEGVQPPSSN